MEKDATDAASAAFRNVVHVDRVESLEARMLQKVIERRNFSLIIAGGGSPCQGNSFANKSRRGLQDPRSQQPDLLRILVDDIRNLDVVKRKGIAVLSWLENVASATDKVKQAYCTLLGADAITIDAKYFGYVRRHRIFFGGDGKRGLHDHKWQPPADFETSCNTDGSVAVHFKGSKPIPRSAALDHGFTLPFNPIDVLRTPDQALQTFTREYYHASEASHAAASSEAMALFKRDNCRFAPRSYESGSLLAKGSDRRVPNSRERLLMHGFPPSILDGVTNKGRSAAQVEAAKNSLVGNGFHLPSVMCFLFILLQLAEPAEAKLARNTLRSSFTLAPSVANTIFDDHFLLAFPGVMDGTSLALDIQAQFEGYVFPINLFDDFKDASLLLPLARLQAYWVWTQQQHLGDHMQGPDWTAQRRRGLWSAALGAQRYAGNSKHGLDHLLPPGLSKEAHIARATQLDSPFSMKGVRDHDVDFTAVALATLGPYLEAWRQTQMEAIKAVQSALEDLETWLRNRMTATVKKIARGSCPAWVAAMTSLLRWPDRRQARSYVEGFRISGTIEPTGVFRQLQDPEAVPSSPFGDEALKALDELKRSRVSTDASEILDITVAEQAKGWLSLFYTEEDLNLKYGLGQWRFVPRFLISQKLKKRIIDDARRGGQNALASFSETIFTCNVDFVGEVLSAWTEHLLAQPGDTTTAPAEPEAGTAHQDSSGKRSLETDAEATALRLPSWFSPTIALDDLPDAYRGVPIHPDDARVALVAVWNGKTRNWLFAEAHSMLFGLSAAVIHFNRKPTLLVAAARRFGAVASAAFFDDICVVASRSSMGSDKVMLDLLLDSTGSPAAPDKSAPPADTRVWIGTMVNLAPVAELGFYEVKPTTSSTSAVVLGCTKAVQDGKLSKTDAASLRGKAGWSNSHSAGRCGRIGLEVLKDKQYGGVPALDESDKSKLRFLAALSANLPVRRVWVFGNAGPPLVMYSDASYDQGDKLPGLGWVLFIPGERPQGRALRMSQAHFDQLRPRHQQIFPAEAYAVYAAAAHHIDELAGRDVVFYIDNESVTAAAVRGTSKEFDVESIIQSLHWLLFSVGARAWFEWIDSNANCSDGLSRDGVGDTWTASQQWEVREVQGPKWPSVNFHKDLALETLGLC